MLNVLKGLITLIIIFTSSVYSNAESLPNAESVLGKTAAAFKKTTGVTMSFSISGGEINSTGKMKVLAEKFALIMAGNAPSTWYNGKTAVTYDPATKEAIYTNPDASEINIMNPYWLVCNYKNIFNVKTVATKSKGVYCIHMSPKSKNNKMSALLYIDIKNYHPIKISVMDNTGNKKNITTIIIKDYSSSLPLKASDFEFPRKKFPGAKINDLR